MPDKYRPHICCQILLQIFLLFLTAPPAISALQPSYIRGTINSSYNNGPIPGVTITSTIGVSTYSSAGTFSLSGPPDIYNIFFTAPGYKANFISGIHANPGQTTNISVQLSPASTETGYISGKVTGGTSGTPVKNAYVLSSLGGFTVTDENGLFTMATPSGPNILTICSRDFESRISDEYLILPFITTNTNQQLKPHHGDEIVITGEITDLCSGALITEAVVQSSTGKVESFTNGNYVIKAPSGKTTIIVTAEGYQFSYKTINTLPLSTSNRANIRLAPAEKHIGLSKGAITDSITGEPLDNVLLETDNNEISVSKKNGEYKMYASLCSSIITAEKSGYSVRLLPVTFLQGIAVTQDITMDPLASVTGTIQDSMDGHQIRGAQVKVEGSSISKVKSDINGTYLIQNIPPGTYDLSASHGCYEDASAQVTLVIGDTQHKNFILTPAATGVINGYVYDRFTNEPIPDAVVKADHGTQTTTSATGYYSMTLPAECSTNITFTANGYIGSTKYNQEITSSAPVALDSYLTSCPILLSLNSFPVKASRLSMQTLLRNKRNQILAGHTPLKKHIRAYYRHAFEISSILQKNPELLKGAGKLLSDLYVYMTGRKNNNKARFLKSIQNKAGLFIQLLINKASSKSCKRDLNALLQDLKNTTKLHQIF